MKPIYEIVEDKFGEIITRIDSDGTIWSIPNDAGNSDYQAYLRWLENPDAEQSGTL